MDKIKCFKSFINNQAISIPNAFLSLSEGDHTITYDQHDIIVKLQRQSPTVVDSTFCTGKDFSTSSSSESIVGLLLQVLIASASKQNEVIIEGKTAEVRRTFLQCA